MLVGMGSLVVNLPLGAAATREGTGEPHVSSTSPCAPSAVRTTALIVSCGGRMSFASESSSSIPRQVQG